MKYVPEWFPGATFQKKAREWKVLATKMLNDPYEAAKETYVSYEDYPGCISLINPILASRQLYTLIGSLVAGRIGN